MTVASDSTTLIVLANTHRFDLLENLFRQVHIPQAVYAEINQKNAVNLPAFVHPRHLESDDDLALLLHLLDRGESEAIHLAAKSNLPLIIDEKRGRKIAASMGLKIIGLAGIVYLNAKRRHISKEEAEAFLQSVREGGFRISQRLVDQVVEGLG